MSRDIAGRIAYMPAARGMRILLAERIWTDGGLAKAYVLINTDTGMEEEVLKELRQIQNVTEAYTIYGVYDLIAKVEADSLDKVKDIVSSRIRRLEHVRSTLSMMVVEP